MICHILVIFVCWVIVIDVTDLKPAILDPSTGSTIVQEVGISLQKLEDRNFTTQIYLRCIGKKRFAGVNCQ